MNDIGNFTSEYVLQQGITCLENEARLINKPSQISDF